MHPPQSPLPEFLPGDRPPPPDPSKLTLQVVVDIICLVLSVAAAFGLVRWLVALRHPGDTASQILFSLFALGGASAVVFLGVGLRAWVRGLFGVADTERREEPDDSRNLIAPEPEEDDLSEPTVCLVCRAQIPAGAAQCPSCGWSYRKS
jgi:hypothetical protein